MEKAFNTGKYYKFFMYIVVIVLINIAGVSLFFRADLTSDNVFSLSDASKEVASALSEPLTVKVFFTNNLPAPYNNIERYLHDLLQEYSIAGNRYFNYQFYTVSSEENETAEENREIARNYGIHPVQIRNIEQDEVKFQKAYMGMALMHGDIIETIPTITSTEGLEFLITSKIRKMNNKISALLALKEKISVNVFLSSSLRVVGPYMNLPGLSALPGNIEKTVEKLNEKTYGRLSFSHLDPSNDKTLEKEAERNAVLSLTWKTFRDGRGKTIPADKGYAGIVVRHGDKSETIRMIKIFRLPLFGTQYQLVEMEELEKNINDAVENMININEEVGYLAGHGTHELGEAFSAPGAQSDESLSNFNKLLSEEYSVTRVTLKDGGIPEGLPSLIIAGARENFSEYELYQIDQYLMKGRNLAVFMDAFNEIMLPQDQAGMMMSRQREPVYAPLNTGLEKLLAHYGLNVKKSYILDENCFKQTVPRAFGGGERNIYFAPLIKNEFINKDLPFMKNIKGLVLLKSSPVEIDEEKAKKQGLQVRKLFSSSERSWEMSGRINLNPLLMQPPRDEKEYRQTAAAYMLEGEFHSYFADKPVPVKEETGAGNQKGAKGMDTSKIRSADITIKKGKPGKIFLIGTSEILKDNILDEEGKGPNAHFVMNVMDYLNNREDYAVMRSKAQRFNPLKDVKPATRTLIKTANIAGLPVLVVFSGLIVWFRRVARKRIIQQMFRK